jgi:hypothetical protein
MADTPQDPQEETPPRRTDPRVLEILVCPRTKTALLYDEARRELVSRALGVAYPIRDGVPRMSEEEARELSEEELRALGKR